jgi:Holliday junction resolvase RusA-like endonuclease
VAGCAWIARGAGVPLMTDRVGLICRFRVSRARDLDKLTRAICDALTEVIYVDDKQVKLIHAEDVATGPLGVMVTVWSLDTKVESC